MKTLAAPLAPQLLTVVSCDAERYPISPGREARDLTVSVCSF